MHDSEAFNAVQHIERDKKSGSSDEVEVIIKFKFFSRVFKSILV